jgi:hypothetical protein
VRFLFKSRLNLFDVLWVGMCVAFAPWWVCFALAVPAIVFSALMEEHL